LNPSALFQSAAKCSFCILPVTLFGFAARLIVWLWCDDIDGSAKCSGAQKADKAGEYKKAD
jgi:hypothetical protein